MFGMGGQPQPKGDIRALWNALGIQPTGDQGGLRPLKAEVVWQEYNPYPKIQGQGLDPELVFIRDDMTARGETKGTRGEFNPEEPVVAHFEEVLFPYPTGISQKMGSKTKFTELVRTADSISGTIEADKLEADRIDERLLQRDGGKPSSRGYILAAWIRGEGESAAAEASEGEKAKSVEVKPTAVTKSDDKGGVNAIYVADIDLLGSFFVQQGRNEPNTSIKNSASTTCRSSAI